MSMLLNGLAGINLNQSLGTHGLRAVRLAGDGGDLRRDGAHDQARAARHHGGRRYAGPGCDPRGGHGGSFLGADHTVRHFRKELYFPRLFRRQTIDQWLEAGAKMGHEVAHERVQEILAQAGPVPLPAGVDAALEQALQDALRRSERPAASQRSNTEQRHDDLGAATMPVSEGRMTVRQRVEAVLRGGRPRPAAVPRPAGDLAPVARACGHPAA